MLDIEGQDKLLIEANPSTLPGYSMESLSYRVLILSIRKVASSKNTILDEKSITNGAMSGVANPYIDTNQHYEASVDKMLDPRLELLKGTNDKLDYVIPTMKKHLIGLSAPPLFNLKSLMTWMMSPSDPDAQYNQSTASIMIVLAAH